MKQTSGSTFFDSNVLVYLYERRQLEAKTARAQLAVDNTPVGVVSTQVLAEFCNVALRKLRIDAVDVFQSLTDIRRAFFVYTNTAETIEEAVTLQKRYGYSFYDSLILSAALHAGCDTLYSEDLQHNQIIEGRLRILNPFV